MEAPVPAPDAAPDADVDAEFFLGATRLICLLRFFSQTFANQDMFPNIPEDHRRGITGLFDFLELRTVLLRDPEVPQMPFHLYTTVIYAVTRMLSSVEESIEFWEKEEKADSVAVFRSIARVLEELWTEILANVAPVVPEDLEMAPAA